MKKLFIASIAVAAMAGCSSNKTDLYQQQAARNLAEQKKNVQNALDQAPEWMINLPKSSSALYANGTAVSGDLSMADLKAKTIAYAKICTAAGGRVSSQMKVFRADTEITSAESSDLTIRSICPDIDITGVETTEVKRIAEGGRFRTYVLVALPIGDANSMKKNKQAEKAQADAVNRAPEAFKELDAVVEKKPNN